MSESVLIRSKGAALVSPEELADVKAPPPQGRWYPLSHTTVLNRVKDTLQEQGYRVRKEQLALSRGSARFFGTLDLDSRLTDGVTLSVGVRNSTDKSFPIGFCAGSRVLVCENLAFRAELLVRRKHTLRGEQRFTSDIAAAVGKLEDFRKVEEARIAAMREMELSNDRADALILRAYDKGIVPATSLSRIIREWRDPKHDEFRPRTHWSLFNAFTEALGPQVQRNPYQFAVTTMRLNSLLYPENALPALAA